MTKYKKEDENVGFKDFLKNTKVKTKDSDSATRRQEGHELTSFLEKESLRLDSLINLLDQKAYLLKNYPQDIVIQVHQEAHNDLMREEIIKLLKQKDSPLYHSLNEIFKTHF